MSLAHNIPVLMYHHVTAAGGSLAVGVRQFESQMQGLARHGWKSLGAAEFAAFMAGGPAPKKSVLITFDDGYLDNWVYAYPILQRYGLTALLFTITGLMGPGPIRPHLGQGNTLPSCPDHHQAKELMSGPEPDRVMLRWAEIQTMHKTGTFEIHSHTHTHTRWDKVCDSVAHKTDQLHLDLDKSRQVLTEQFGSASTHLCWPQGYFDDDYLAVAAQLGYTHLYTTDARGQNLPHGNTAYIYRFAVRNRTWPWLAQRLWLATHPTWGPLYNRWKARS